MNYEQWASVYPEAAAALMTVDDSVQHGASKEGSEASVLGELRQEASELGNVLWRNNVGQLLDKRGIPLRYGICNESAALNAVVKSSDLIGIYRRLILPADVGTYIGQFDAVEAKHRGWKYTGTKHEMGQKAFGMKVVSLGGRFRFSTGRGA